MWKYVLLLPVLLLTLTTNSIAAVDVGPTVTVARCRAYCIEETLNLKNRPDYDACVHKKSCRNCWQMCQFLVLSYPAWSQMCLKKKFCKKGCRKACQFTKNIPETTPSQVKWNLSKPVALQYHETSRLVIVWNPPTSAIKNSEQMTFIYVLFVRDSLQNHEAWRQISQTSSTKLKLSQNDVPKVPEFLLLVVTQNGTIAEVKFNITTDPVVDVISQPVESISDSKINVTVISTVNETNSDGTLDAIVEWHHPQGLPKLPQYAYTVNWFLLNCGIYTDSPYCNIPDQHFANTVFVNATNTKPSYRIKAMVYNAKYLMKIELGNNRDWSGKAKLFTLDCPNVDLETYRECPQYRSHQRNSSDQSLDRWNSTNHSMDKWTRGQVINWDREDFKLLFWTLNVTSKVYDNMTDMVIVGLNWSVPFNHSVVEFYSLRWSIMDHSDGIEIFKQNCTKSSIQLKLKPHKQYEVQAVAYYKDIMGNSVESESEIRELNTSGINELPWLPRSQTLVVNRKPPIKNLDGIIVGITIVLIILMLGLIILFVYKKRQSFKDIIITKTAVAKSNSYKSNVGCKVDYSNQLLVMSDEWELETRLVKFSSPIGQGAFGKVVTGYYEDRRVAIKLVRDSAPLSYKEDLLAEINLMKRIGSHPNIVSMIGACTLSEPIALVMEYIPYGNLQNFLKKCRLEGELQKRTGHPCEITYSIMDHSGGIDSGVITPADMLSFARQVAMAMEYLAEKRYVHRDLAARNILLDYNKIVKVCDFGLSRDIFNDNQYHKITSGKLPLKWMAIESLRDKIFTTPSDVWSFGILLWEIVTMGGSPYPSIALADLYTFLSNGYRMEKPSNCSEELYVIMSQCWTENPADRLTFTEIRLELEQLLSRDRNYLELDNIDIPLCDSSSGSSPKCDTNSGSLITHISTTQPCMGMQPCKSDIIPQDPTIVNMVNVCIENSTERLIRHDDETAS